VHEGWQPIRISEVAALFAGFDGPWWLAGGVAIELFVGAPFRSHGDIDVVILRTDQSRLHDALAGWELWAVDPPGALRPWPAGEVLPASVHDIWCRDRPDGPWRLQVMIDESDGACWVSRRDPRIRRPLVSLGHDADGVPYLAPEVQLFYKSRRPRPRDELDFSMALPHLSPDQRHWLDEALAMTDERHPWRERLDGT
jgi:hypothetical protein